MEPQSANLRSPFDCYINAWRHYADFSGRSRRREYWFFVLFNILISMALSIIDSALGLGNAEIGAGLFSGLYGLAVLLPSIGYAARRLHDIGRSAWWLLVIFIPLLGPLIMLVFTVLDSQPGDNAFGPNPKGIDDPER